MSATLNLLAGAELIFADERRWDGGGKKTIVGCRYVGDISQKGEWMTRENSRAV